jgi:hypothetical protein
MYYVNKIFLSKASWILEEYIKEEGLIFHNFLLFIVIWTVRNRQELNEFSWKFAPFNSVKKIMDAETPAVDHWLVTTWSQV